MWPTLRIDGSQTTDARLCHAPSHHQVFHESRRYRLVMRVAGLLLTGGASRRLGVSKPLLEKDGERLVDRSARVLRKVCDPVIEVGPGFTSLLAAHEDPPGQGPLAGFAAGAATLRAEHHEGDVIVLAVDLPEIDASFLEWLARHRAPDSVVPRVDGMAQTLCARYTSNAGVVAAGLVAAGERSMRALLDAIPVTYVDAVEWERIAAPDALMDVDTAEDVVRAGLRPPR